MWVFFFFLAYFYLLCLANFVNSALSLEGMAVPISVVHLLIQVQVMALLWSHELAFLARTWSLYSFTLQVWIMINRV